MFEVAGAIECSLNDDLRPMIASLKRAAVITQEAADGKWREAMRLRGESAKLRKAAGGEPNRPRSGH